MSPTVVTYSGASLLLPEGYSSAASADGLLASNPHGDFLQLRAQPSNLPGPILSLLGRNRELFLQLLSAQAPVLLRQAINAQSAQEATASFTPIASELISTPAGSALFASTVLSLRGTQRTLCLWLLASPSLAQFYVLSLSASADLSQVQTLMAPVLTSLSLRD